MSTTTIREMIVKRTSYDGELLMEPEDVVRVVRLAITRAINTVMENDAGTAWTHQAPSINKRIIEDIIEEVIG